MSTASTLPIEPGDRFVPVPWTTALLVVDVQKGFDAPVWGRRNHPEMEERIVELLAAFRESGRRVLHAKHMSTHASSPLFPGKPGNAFKEEVMPRDGEQVIEKSAHSCFIGTPLEAELRRSGCDTLVIAGMTTNHCVSTTARMASDLGFRTIVVWDATATFDLVGPDGLTYQAEWVHSLALADLHEEFAEIVPTRAVVRALRR